MLGRVLPSGMIVGVDFGITVTDAVSVVAGRAVEHRSLVRPGPACEEVLGQALANLQAASGQVAAIAVTGGRSRELPDSFYGVPIVKISEPTATARGGLTLVELERAMVVSCGTGTAIVDADVRADSYQHVSGTPVGGGTLAGLGSLLVAGADAVKVAELALTGSASGVDTTLADVLGGSLGHLPANATAVSFGRVATLTSAPEPADLAAGLTTMVAQTIALITLNTALARGVETVVFVGRTARFQAIERMIRAVFAVYSYPSEPLFPAHGEQATALGAALVLEAQRAKTDAGTG